MADGATEAEKEAAAKDQVRTTLADVYTFVRSREVNRQIASFTLDHYIEEAKARLNGADRQLTDASGKPISATKGLGTRPSQLSSLKSLRSSFSSAKSQLEKLAEKADSAAKQEAP